MATEREDRSSKTDQPTRHADTSQNPEQKPARQADAAQPTERKSADAPQNPQQKPAQQSQPVQPPKPDEDRKSPGPSPIATGGVSGSASPADKPGSQSKPRTDDASKRPNDPSQPARR